MSDRAFLDTNVIAYTLANDARKKEIAESLLLNRPVISVQVVNELVSVAMRKLAYPRDAAISAARVVMDQCEVMSLEPQNVLRAFAVGDRYGFSHWDALIVAVASRLGCDTLYSEDMQDGQVLAAGLRVVNPFKPMAEPPP
jgi:predicted nucleic acid-binding protein